MSGAVYDERVLLGLGGFHDRKGFAIWDREGPHKFRLCHTCGSVVFDVIQHNAWHQPGHDDEEPI